MKSLPPLPSLDDIFHFIEGVTSSPPTKRDIIRAFDIKGEERRRSIKDALKILEQEGRIEREKGGGYVVSQALPSVAIVEICMIDVDGDLFVKLVDWDESQNPCPRIELIPEDKKGHPALKEKDKVLARLSRTDDPSIPYEARIIRRMDVSKNQVLGLLRQHKNGWSLIPSDKRARYEVDVPPDKLGGAKSGDLVVGELQLSPGIRRKQAKIIKRLGRFDDPKAISLIALHAAGLHEDFPATVLSETDGMKVPDLKGREDLRNIPLITIDGADARDFDDAVFAQALDGGGFHIVVAIADVAYYVRPYSALDREARLRGNSTYFPDRVVPMLPEALSNDLCSLRPKENRACMAFHLFIDENGSLLRYKIVRGLMRSEARLTYDQVQAARDGLPDDMTEPLRETVIAPLYAAYSVLLAARQKRGALDLDLPERQILIDEKGNMTGVRNRTRYDSHKLIEEFMILANVAAARALEERKAPCVYRIHDRPSLEKLDSAREFLSAFDLSLPKGQSPRPGQINLLLEKAKGQPYSHLISDMILRTQSQAVYHTENIGHFGLALEKYAHFTSPIRRYADLLVHRALIKAYDLGDGGLTDEETVTLQEAADHISQTERTSAEAERNAVDRFTARWMSERIGAEFSGRINGVTRFGLFVTLLENGADGLVPISSLPQDFYAHDEQQHALVGQRTGRIYRLGAQVMVRIVEADGLTGSSIFSIVGTEGADIPGISFPSPQLSGSVRRKGGKFIKNKGPRAFDRNKNHKNGPKKRR